MGGPRPVVLIGVVALATGAAFAAPERSRLPVAEQGLAVETVTAVYRDRTGFLWVGSRGGLIRYDGYGWITLEHDVSDPSSLSDNAVRTLFEDREGGLWIGTNAGGLDRLDRATWKFTSYRHDAADPGSIGNDSVYAIAEDRDGRLWVGTQAGLNRLDPRTGRFERFPAGPAGPAGDYVDALHLDARGALWIGTVGQGLSRRDPDTGAFSTFRHDPRHPGSLPDDTVLAIAEDERGRLWLGTGAGPCRLDPADGTFRSYRFPGEESGTAAYASGVVVDPDHGVWASSVDSGLWKLDPRSDRFEPRPYRRTIPGEGAVRIVALSGDAAGNIWVSTWGGGLGQATRSSRSIGTLAIQVGPGEPQVQDIAAVFEDHRGRLWLGDAGSGLHVRADGRMSPRIELPGTVLSFCEGQRNRMWVGTTRGLLRFDEARAAPTPVSLGGPAGAAGSPWIWGLAVDHAGDLWAAAGDKGLYRLRGNGDLTHYGRDPASSNSLSDDYTTAVLEDRHGTLWVGTRSGGLDAFDASAGRWSRYLPDPADPRSLSHVTVTALLEASDGTLWIGTGGGGVNRMERDPGTGGSTFVRVTEEDGLIDNNVVSLVEDADGTVWIGTRRGLSRLDPKRRRFESFGVEDGLPSAELHQGAAARGSDRLYFGTHRGVVVVPLSTDFPPPRSSPTVITSIRSPSGPVAADRPPWEMQEILLPYGQVVSFDFTLLSFGDRRRYRYAYRLDPPGGDWIDLGAKHDITFTRLDPGTTTLHVRGLNDQGVWTETAQPLSIRVIPPFWMTAWFKTLIIVLVVGAALAAHVLRTRSLARRNRELSALKDQRERALAEAGESQRKLGEAYRRLRALTSRLESAKEEERKWLARELHDELGTSLTTAKLLLELLADADTPEDRGQRTREAIGLIDRMIGHSRALSVDLRPPLLDELGLAAALRGYVEGVSRRAGIAIDLDAAELPARLPEGASIAAFRVVQESLTNAVRHAEARRAEVAVRYDAGWLAIAVGDDGNGFDVDAAVERASSGRHAGLMGMKERVESMGGSLTIVASEGKGTRIEARLPVES